MQVPSCFCIKIRRIASALTRLYDNALAPCQITISQYSLLCHIRVLSDATGLDRSTLARNLRQLLKKGWVEDARAPGARNCQLRLTADGHALLAQAHPLWQQIQQQTSAIIDEQRLDVLNSLLIDISAI